MQKFPTIRAGKAIIDTKDARVSAQKSHTGCSKREKAQKNRIIPPAAPRTMNPRSSPSPRRRIRRKNRIPAARQYAPSSRWVLRGSFSRKGRSRSYRTPEDTPSRTDWANSINCCDG